MTAPTLHDAPVFGWDVGGAHVKVSMATRAGVLADVAQWACPLWQGMAHLERAIDAMFERWPAAADPAARHAVTMTGEMVDLFADRAEGVRALTRALAQRLGPRTMFFAGDAGWLARSACAEHWRKVASANWLATAQWVAACLPDALLVDIGSTTTDIIPIVGRRVVARGTSDAERLVSGELVYQGVVRTPLCGLAHRIAFRGEHAGVMNEWFATTADVYRLTGELWPEHDQHPSADNGPKTQAASRVRIARMIGRDAADASDAEGGVSRRAGGASNCARWRRIWRASLRRMRRWRRRRSWARVAGAFWRRRWRGRRRAAMSTSRVSRVSTATMRRVPNGYRRARRAWRLRCWRRWR